MATAARAINDKGELLRQLAEQLDLFTEDDHLLLSGWTRLTAEGKRKRGEGPPFLRLGRNYFYPRPLYREYLKDLVRERTRRAAAKELL